MKILEGIIKELTQECIRFSAWSTEAWNKAEEFKNDINTMNSYIQEAIYMQGKHEVLLTTLDKLEALNKGQ